MRYRGEAEDGESVAIKAVSLLMAVSCCGDIVHVQMFSDLPDKKVIPTWRLVLEPGCEVQAETCLEQAASSQ